MGEDTVCLGWELSHGFLWLGNALSALQGHRGAGQAPAVVLGFFLLLLELIFLSPVLSCAFSICWRTSAFLPVLGYLLSDLHCGLQGQLLSACACEVLCGFLTLCDSDSAFQALGSFALDTTWCCDIWRSSGSSLVMLASEREVTLVLWSIVNMAVASFYLASFTFTCDLCVSRAFLEAYFSELTGRKSSR